MMANRFRIMLKTIENTPENTITIVRAIIELHNFLSTEKISANASYDEQNNERDEDMDFDNAVDEWNETYDHLASLGNQTFQRWQVKPQQGCHNAGGRQCRDFLTEYFMKKGSIDFQWNRV
jgi:hypothetical protein